jgi:hypothetical protein
MKNIDTSKCELIYAGKIWTHPLPPCSRDMLPLLERQEMCCSWFQPINKSIDHQFPALKIDINYYAMSLRMQKAVFRHIRLHPGFMNVESTPCGRQKLRIPQSLLLEKQRTACRFTVIPVHCTYIVHLLYVHIYPDTRYCVNLNINPCDVPRILQGVKDESRQVQIWTDQSRRRRSTVHRSKHFGHWTRSAR